MDLSIVLLDVLTSASGAILAFVVAIALLAFIAVESAAILLGLGLAVRELLGHSGIRQQ